MDSVWLILTEAWEGVCVRVQFNIEMFGSESILIVEILKLNSFLF